MVENHCIPNPVARANLLKLPRYYQKWQGYEAIVDFYKANLLNNMNVIDEELTNIFEAILNNDLSRISELIARGVNINQQYFQTGLTPLVQAINLCQIKIIQVLLEAGADVHLSQYIQTTPLGLATSLGNIEIIQLLLQAGANPNSGGIDDPPLHRAIQMERIDIIEILIKAGANLNQRNASNFTPLMEAANNGKFEMVKFLVETGKVYINAKDEDGETALDKARYWGYEEIINYLLPWASFCE